MHYSDPNFRRKPFRLKHEDDGKFFTRFISKESSKSNSSFRVYYRDVPSAVPFTWEIIPGTPKHKSSENYHIPPLTPPPSYYTNNLNNYSKNHSRSKLILHNLLRKMNLTKKSNFESSSHSSSSSLSSLSSSSAAHSLFSDPITKPGHLHERRRFFRSWGSTSSDAKSVDVPSGEVCCFGIGKDNGERIQSGYSVLIVKKALLSIIGRGSA
ncbi:hypothetical protein OROGR_017433 [Orobanche gracilis]